MINVTLAVFAGLLVGAAVWAWLGWLAALLPAILATGAAMYLLARRTGKLVEAEIAPLVGLLTERKVDEAEALLRAVKEKHGRWQFMLEGQMDAQIGMIRYLQLKFDEALPFLEAGRFRNWTALLCIGAIHARRKRYPEAWKALSDAASASSTQAIIYEAWAVLATRAGQRDEALSALDKGLKALPAHQGLTRLQSQIANKQKIDTKQLPELWFQFFPEEMAQQQLMRGRKNGPPQGPPQQQIKASAWRRR